MRVWIGFVDALAAPNDAFRAARERYVAARRQMEKMPAKMEAADKG